MKLVRWTDERGFYQLSWLRDEDPDDLAPSGLPAQRPDVELLDWEAIKRDLHNALIKNGLLSEKDLRAGNAQERLKGAILSAMRRQVISIYREGKND